MAISATLKYSATSVELTSTIPFTTSAFTPGNNVLLVVAFNCIDGATNMSNLSISSSPSLTWTRRKKVESVPGAGYTARSEIWTAPVTTGASTTITLSTSVGFVFNSDGIPGEVSVVEYAGYDSVTPIGVDGGAGVNGAHSSSNYSLSLSGTSASDSAIHATSGLDGDHFDPLVGVGSGWTALYNVQSGGDGWFRSCTEYVIGAVSSAEWTSFYTPYAYTAAAIEIKAAGGGGGGAIVAKKLINMQAVRRAAYW